MDMYFVKTDSSTYDIKAETLHEAKRTAARYAHKSKNYIELYDSQGEYLAAYNVQGGYWLSKRVAV